MDWLGECVEGSLPRYDQLDVRTLGLRSAKPVGQREETLVNVVARKPLQGKAQ